jgi:hypothetical protein
MFCKRIYYLEVLFFYRLPKLDLSAGTLTPLRVLSSTSTLWKLSNLSTRPNTWMLSRDHKFGRLFRVERLPNVQVSVSPNIFYVIVPKVEAVLQ